MSREYIEITEKTVDDAITAACTKLGVTSVRLDYEVIQREKSGFLGIGAKPAIIKARIKETEEVKPEAPAKKDKKLQAPVKKAAESAPAKKAETEPAAPAPAAEVKEEKKAAEKPVETESKRQHAAQADEEKKEVRKNRNRRNRKPRSAKKSQDEPAKETAAASAPAKEKAEPKKKAAAVPVLTDEQIADIKQKADVFLKDVFHAMNMEVEISEHYNKETGILTVDIEGDDMGVLIGKRGQTLDSLQYLVSLIVNKGIDGYVHVKADTENYRERRKKTLENLARNIASKVKKTRKAVSLEPMNPYERRIIHSALQGDKYVTTYSEGEEPNRKVIVSPKK